MPSSSGVKRLLLGIELTVFAGVLALTSSGLDAVVFLVALVGLALSVSGLVDR